MYVQQETETLLLQLAAIPAPSGQEDQRVAFIKAWLEHIGCESVCIDDAKNVVYTYHPELPGPVDLFCAHTDVVFGDMTPLPMAMSGDTLTGPGCGDDTASLVLMLLALKELRESGIVPQRPMVFAANSCEEGLGNLKGSRHLVATYQGRLHSFTSFDAHWGQVVDTAVGSERYLITCRTAGGHSYRDYGAKNAIVDMATLISLLSGQTTPDDFTTCNVGTIAGGTTVNSIPSECTITYEYRATSKESLAVMRRQLENLVAECAERGLRFTVETIGCRPTGKLENAHQQQLVALAERVIRHNGGYPVRCVGSNDCNVPLSVGIPSVCLGIYEGAGSHTRQETVKLSSLKAGFKATLEYLKQIAQGALDW